MKPFVLACFLLLFSTAVFVSVMPPKEATVSLNIADKTVSAPLRQNNVEENETPPDVADEPVAVRETVSEPEESSIAPDASVLPPSDLNEEKRTQKAEAVSYNVRMRASDCDGFQARRVMQDAAYVPEISTTGQSVASAEYRPDAEDGVSVSLPDDFVFPVTLKLEKKYPYFQSKLEIGEIPLISVRFENGRVLLNEEPVGDADLKMLEKACRHRDRIRD